MLNRVASDQAGFSLIEILIAVAIMAVVALEMSSLFQMMNNNNASLQGKMGSLSLTSSLIQTIANPSNCLQHLLPGYTTYNAASANGTGLPLGFIGDDGVSNIVGPVTPGGSPVPLPNYNVSVNYLYFKQSFSNSVGTDPYPTGNPTNAPLYQGALVVGLVKGASSASNTATGGRGLKDITIGTLNLAVDASNNIVDCFAQPIQAVDACNSLGGIYNVAANPPCQLPYPCNPGYVFMGYDASQNPVCSTAATVSVLSCGNGQTVVSSNGVWVCN